jgi:hypothetical protein
LVLHRFPLVRGSGGAQGDIYLNKTALRYGCQHVLQHYSFPHNHRFA